MSDGKVSGELHNINGHTARILTELVCRLHNSTMSDYQTNALNDALRYLADSPLPATARQFLKETAGAVGEEWRSRVVADIPAFTKTRNPDVLPTLAAHCPQHVNEIRRLLGGDTIGDFEFVHAHARVMAGQRFPLEATLHSYRIGNKVFSRWIREAALAGSPSSRSRKARQIPAAVADFTIEYMDAVSTIFAGTYVDQMRFLAEVATDQRTELLGILLNGHDESDGRVATILRDAGYLDGRQSFCVALSRSLDPAEMLNLGRARRMADSVDEALRSTVARRVVDVRDNKVVLVLSDLSRVSGFTRQRGSLAERVATRLAILGPAVLVGVSNDVTSTSRIPTAYREAKLALEFAGATRRVTRVAELGLHSLMLHFSRDRLRGVLPAWSADFTAADNKLGGALTATLRAYARADMNALKAAQHLAVHPNTIHSRFQKIQDVTQLNARSYRALSELLLAADCTQPHRHGP